MDYTTYKLIHLVGIAIVALGMGGMMANGNNRKTFAIWQGVGLLVMLVSGFGLLAKMHLGFPHFAMAKVLFWALLAVTPVIIRKSKAPLSAGIVAALALVAILAWLGVVKPALW